MDLIMGTFADVNVPDMDTAALDLYEEVLHTPDPDVYDWITRRVLVPANLMNPVVERLLDHDYTCHSPLRQDGNA